ncbi:MAG: acyltransferase [Geitlerinemataceae cyanobacterium]
MKPLTQSSLDSSKKITQNRVDILLTLRGLACLMVVVAHCNFPRASLVYHTFDLSWLLFSAGGVAVRIFFCLSGYFMGKAFCSRRYAIDRSGILNFWRNRALRVFPLYYFSVIVTGFWIYPDLFKVANWGYLLRILTFTYNQTLPIAFNGALWTLSTEVQFYLLVPFIFIYCHNRLCLKTQVKNLALGIIVGSFVLRWICWGILQFKFQPPEDAIAFVQYIYVPLWMNLDVFLCGFLLNFWINYDDTQKSQNPFIYPIHLSGCKHQRFRTYSQINCRSIAIFLVLLLYFFTAYFKYYNQQILGLFSPTLTLLVTCFLIYTVEKPSELPNADRRNRKLSLKACRDNPWRIWEVLGVLSYGIYIWHLPILSAIHPIVTSESLLAAYFYRFFATLILSTLLATVTYYIIELPTANLKKITPHS